MHKLLIAIGGLATSLATIESAQPAPQCVLSPTEPFADPVAVVQAAMAQFNVPGMAIGVVADGKVLLARGYGYRDCERQLPVTEHTLFAIGSCTKAFTTFLLGQLVDEGKLSWDDPVISHIPEFRLKDPYTTATVTIRDLVAHRSGMARHDLVWFQRGFTRAKVLPSLQHLESACTLRDKFQYNNLMYAVAGLIIERVTGQTYEEALTSRILAPLQMQRTTAYVAEAIKDSDVSLPYIELGGTLQEVPFRDLHAVAPAGAINSSAADMLQWVQLQLAGDRLIRKETLQEIHATHMAIPGAVYDEDISCFGYGLGWATGTYRGHTYLHHGGGIDGFISQVALLPQKKIGIVVLCNTVNGGLYAVSSVANSIIDQLLGAPEKDWIQKWDTLRQQVKQAEQKPTSIKDTSLMPPNVAEEYVGSYEHPAYGVVDVRSENDRLLAGYGDIAIPLTHKCRDVFVGKMGAPFDGCPTDVPFIRNTAGDICALSMALDASVKPIIFQRKASRDLFALDYLQQFEGTFGEGLLAANVVLRGDSLLFSSTGFGQHELAPEKRELFSIPRLPGYSVRFVLAEEGNVAELIFIHPMGSLALKSVH